MKLFIPALALLAATAAFANTECGSEEHYPMIDKKELTTVVEAKKAVVIDVNSQDSYKEHHVPGAFHFGSHEKDFAKQLPSDKSALIVAYCGGPECGAWKKAAEKACQLGYTNVKHFKGGIKGWVSKN